MFYKGYTSMGALWPETPWTPPRRPAYPSTMMGFGQTMADEPDVPDEPSAPGVEAGPVPEEVAAPTGVSLPVILGIGALAWYFLFKKK